MKKLFFLAAFFIASIFAYAIPSGCYSGTSRPHRDRCAIQISDNILYMTSRDGTVTAKWTIVSDKDGILTLRSEYGATLSASWWVDEDGDVHLNLNYETFTRM